MDFTHTFDYERVILGCLAKYPERFGDYVQQMTVDLFAEENHRDIFNAIEKAHQQTTQYDIQLICANLSHPDESKVELYRCGEVAFKSTPFDVHYMVLIEVARERFIHDQLMSALAEGEPSADRLREIAEIAEKTYNTND